MANPQKNDQMNVLLNKKTLKKILIDNCDYYIDNSLSSNQKGNIKKSSSMIHRDINKKLDNKLSKPSKLINVHSQKNRIQSIGGSAINLSLNKDKITKAKQHDNILYHYYERKTIKEIAQSKSSISQDKIESTNNIIDLSKHSNINHKRKSFFQCYDFINNISSTADEGEMLKSIDKFNFSNNFEKLKDKSDIIFKYEIKEKNTESSNNREVCFLILR